MSSEQKPVPPNHWMVSEAGQQQGPYTSEQIKQMIHEGRLPALALVWTPGMSEWKPWAQMPELQSPAAAQPAGMPSRAAALRDRLLPSDWPEVLHFRRMFTPLIIPLIYWIGLGVNGIAFLLLLLGALFGGSFIGFVLGILSAFIWLVVGVLALRIGCELLILAFRIPGQLSEILQRLPEQTAPDSPASAEPEEVT